MPLLDYQTLGKPDWTGSPKLPVLFFVRRAQA
ncbi:MAG: hypothetical protein Q27BB25_17980 [Blastomonas sp. CACIA14H2]|jgi:hypothetical protein|nr:MAG: hypothetical protein Q27BB25_17980 [Blastomonas sp. CACIA14H2]